jgi:hypothetical protein
MTNELVPMDALQQMATAFAKSGMFGAKTPDQCMALLLLASAEGIHPAIAMRDFDIIQGRPSKKAEAMHRSFLAAGGSVEWHQLDDTMADATFSHPQGGTARIKWDMPRVKQAKIANEAMYQKYPRAMLRSRCISEGCRTVYPAATSGLYEPGEVAGFAKAKDMGKAEVVDEGDATLRALESAGVSTRESELEALCKQVGKSQKFYLNRAGVDTASKLSEEDWTELTTMLKAKIKAAQEREELGTA